MLAITNNPLFIRQPPEGVREIQSIEGGYRDVLIHVRDRIHLGHRLVSHPLAGSVKPSETPYRTVMITAGRGSLHLPSLTTLEHALSLLNAFVPFTKPTAENTADPLIQSVLQDLQLIDYELMKSVCTRQESLPDERSDWL